MRVIGLTGGIASGKTTVAEALRRHGAILLDADQIARAVVEPGTPALAEIARVFGPAVISHGGLDRAELGRRVFGDAAARARLNAIVHPAVFEAYERELARLKALPEPPRLVVLVVPLLFETGMQAMADTTWLVTVPPSVQLERLMRRDGLSSEEAAARIASQWPLERKAELSDRLIDNSGTPAEVALRVEEALRAEGLA